MPLQPQTSYPVPEIPEYPVTKTPAPMPSAQVPFSITVPAHALARAEERQRIKGIPNYPTGSRPANVFEDRFIRQAHEAIKRDLEANPGKLHRGEYGFLGDRHGNLMSAKDLRGKPTGEKLRWQEGKAISYKSHEMREAEYFGHSHPPLIQPFSSTASEPDHLAAAIAFVNFKCRLYVTDGTTMSQIQPGDSGLVRLTPKNKADPPPVAFEPPPPPKEAKMAPF